MSKILDALSGYDFPLQDIWVAAAKFAFKNLSVALSQTPKGARVLEVGCGGGILMAMVAEDRPDLKIEGIEPFGDGFSGLAELNSFLVERGMNITKTDYEGFDLQEKYDLIYLVNVFEHLPDWRDFLGFVERALSPGGRCIILCPNYSVPMEPHFKRPVVINKPITGALFSRRISYVEEQYQMPGLWDSLNFVKLGQVRRAMPAFKLKLTSHAEYITDAIIERLSYDPVFHEHMAGIGFVGKVLRALRVTRLLRFRAFRNFHPYMMLELQPK